MRAAPGPSVIDACIHHEIPLYEDLLKHLQSDWRRYVGTPGTGPAGTGALRFFTAFRYPNPDGDYLADAWPDDGTPPGSSLDLLTSQVLGRHNVTRALLMHGPRGMFLPATPNSYLATAAVSALNDWTIAQWLSADDRLHGVVVVPTQNPLDAVAEIRRVGAHPQMAAVLLAAPALGKLFGHPVYHPIYEAAAEYELPLVIHTGGDAVPDLQTGVAGGPPFTFAEYMTVAPLSLWSHTMSMMSHGVLDRYPSLKLFLVGGGISWIPAMIRRMEIEWTALRREIPWAKRPALAYLESQIRVATYGLERGLGRDAAKALAEQNPYFQDLLCYASGYPTWNALQPETIHDVFPPEWHPRIFSENAEEWFRWKARDTRDLPTAVPPQIPQIAHAGKECI